MVKIVVGDGTVAVTSPYHPDFPKRARSLGGKWAAPKWVFDARDEVRVRALCRAVYGTDGTEPTGDLVTLRLTFAANEMLRAEKGGVFLAGRCLAKAYGRDSGAELSGGVVLIEGTAGKVSWGEHPDAVRSGGSMKNWATIIEGPCVIEMRDVPRAAADAAVAESERKRTGNYAGWYYPLVEII